MNSTLASVRNVQTLEILRSICTSNTFLGLDDMVNEGTYVWHDDHTVIEEELMPEIFAPGQPSKGNKQENCVIFDFLKKALNDIPCFRNKTFLCERKCFLF
ncbi:C-type lectin domain family 4 member E [Biomphalaria glabrata]|nr:C-type lectin domain family 4 member E-like [Biomphalaria glabrata]